MRRARFAVVASGHYVLSGADRADARLRLTSGGALAIARWSALHYAYSEDRTLVDLVATAGFGRYFVRETYVNPALSPTTFTKDDGSFGGQLGAEASVTLSGIRAVVGYAFHYAPATVGDRIGGNAYGGGHAITVGLGVRL